MRYEREMKEVRERQKDEREMKTEVRQRDEREM